MESTALVQLFPSSHDSTNLNEKAEVLVFGTTKLTLSLLLVRIATTLIVFI